MKKRRSRPALGADPSAGTALPTQITRAKEEKGNNETME
jgi:hypothetical protein